MICFGFLQICPLLFYYQLNCQLNINLFMIASKHRGDLATEQSSCSSQGEAPYGQVQRANLMKPEFKQYQKAMFTFF